MNNLFDFKRFIIGIILATMSIACAGGVVIILSYLIFS